MTDEALVSALARIPPDVHLLRYGGLLLARHNATFPDRCLITNAPTNLRFRVTFSASFRTESDKQSRVTKVAVIIACSVLALTLANVFANVNGIIPLVYIPVFLVIRNRYPPFCLNAPFCAEELSRYRRSTIIYMTIAAASFLAYVPVAFYGSHLMLLGVSVQITLGTMLLAHRGLLAANSYAEGFIFLEGISPTFLQGLPELHSFQPL